ncbi:capsular polysaccharide export protein, LipB/KpsS family [Vibrio sp. HI00D65]|uniref:capsular polysaccharide export protein, LipB/KpsS family n=1 Tax=Vibrio sp. HI00D65 TaxID=1822216 RepID=UPI0018D2B357|nr:capsule biosynthesis protein [Vibrio sp. HI00D65]
MTEYNLENEDIIAKYGDYDVNDSRIIEGYKYLEKLSKCDLFEESSFQGINLFKIAQAEILSFTMPYDFDLDFKIKGNSKLVFEHLYENHYHVLLSNMSCAMYWLKFWHEKINLADEKYTHAFIFSGSLIYSKSLIEVAKRTRVKTYICESSFTGNEYYIEEKYEHIANNSDIKFSNVRSKIIENNLTDDIKIKESVLKAYRKLDNAKNKNVTQPQRGSEELPFKNDKENVLILAQVVNDFSLLESDIPSYSSIKLYKEIIDVILKETNHNIIVKTHPWEKVKLASNANVTYAELLRYLNESYSKAEISRVFITESFNLQELFELSNHCITINSQSGIESALSGIKPIILGNAFYSGFGFTSDCIGSDEIVEYLSSSSIINLDEYDNLELFLAMYLNENLFSIKSTKSELDKINRVIFSGAKRVTKSKKIEPEKKPYLVNFTNKVKRKIKKSIK